MIPVAGDLLQNSPKFGSSEIPVVKMSTSLDVDRRECATAMIVDVIDRGGEHFVFQVAKDLRRRFGMRAPLDLQHHVVRRDSSFIAFVSDALINEAFHALDEFGSGEPATRLHGAAETAIDDAAHSFEYAAQEAFR